MVWIPCWEQTRRNSSPTSLHAAWVAFATHGDPGWPQYDLSRRTTMRFDTTSEVVNDPRSVERELWAGVR
jgi:carboxylesterase type B